MIQMLYQFMLLEEEPTDTLHGSEHASLLNEIRTFGLLAAEYIKNDTRKPIYGRVWPRTKWRFFGFGRRTVRIWRLSLYHPLWLGDDGKVYRAYETLTGHSYFMEAELHLRDNDGLRLVVAAIKAFVPHESTMAE